MRIPVNAQMFQKSNQKALAMLLYPLLILMLEPFPKAQKYKLINNLNANWFPYGLTEMKAFKQVCMQICDLLAEAHLIPGNQDESGKMTNTVLTKNIMETA